MKTLLLLLLVAGCATQRPPPEIVKVPVSIPCVKSVPVRPVYAVRSLLTDATDGAIVLALALDLPLHLKYEGELEAIIEGCR